jgi:REP element-mobilizing transposase RayT
MHLNEYGKIAIDCWNALPRHYPHVELGDFVIMPNHVHGVVFIRAGLNPARKRLEE